MNTAVSFFLINMTSEFHHFPMTHQQIMLLPIWNNVLHIELNINKPSWNWSRHERWFNRARSIYQYSNMAPRLSEQTSIFGVVFFVSKSLLEIQRQKKTFKIWPKSLGAMLEYCYIEHGLLKPQSRVFANLTGKPWIIVKVSIFNRWANWLWLNNSVSTVTFARQNCWIADLLLLRTSLEDPVWPKLDFLSKRDAIDISFTYLKSRNTICIWNVLYAEKLGTLLAEEKRHLLNY